MDALEALRLQIEWGVDEALDDAPLDRRGARDAPLAPPSAPVDRNGRMGAAAVRPHSATVATSIAELRAALSGFEGCRLKSTATSLVFSDGNLASGLVVIGEAPSDDDDREGRPFSGAGGALLDRVFATIGLDRGQMLLTMLVPWRPPGRSPPAPADIKACLPFLQQHLALLRPRRLVLFGGQVTRALGLGTTSIAKLRGQWQAVEVPGAGAVPALPMCPVETWLKSEAAKRETWADLLTLRAALDASGTGESPAAR